MIKMVKGFFPLQTGVIGYPIIIIFLKGIEEIALQ